jgi:hypothetical protein
MTKAQLQAENEELKQMVEELQPKKKEFNYFNYFKFLALKEYFTKQLKGEDTKELKFFMRNFDSQKSKYFIGNGIQTLDFKFTCNELGQKGIEVTITNLDIKAKAKSKKGDEFFIFDYENIGKAFSPARKALA